ncbi:hypothetical protein TNCV_3629821 [Trichonephila clavipes]|nr:hypothetical protein TNCV_3629821 [Trichonephila clavipes]
MGVPFRHPPTSKVPSNSGSLCFGDQRPAPLFSISLHPARGGKESFVSQGVAREVQGGPRNNFKVQVQMHMW